MMPSRGALADRHHHVLLVPFPSLTYRRPYHFRRRAISWTIARYRPLHRALCINPVLVLVGRYRKSLISKRGGRREEKSRGITRCASERSWWRVNRTETGDKHDQPAQRTMPHWEWSLARHARANAQMPDAHWLLRTTRQSSGSSAAFARVNAGSADAGVMYTGREGRERERERERRRVCTVEGRVCDALPRVVGRRGP